MRAPLAHPTEYLPNSIDLLAMANESDQWSYFNSSEVLTTLRHISLTFNLSPATCTEWSKLGCGI